MTQSELKAVTTKYSNGGALSALKHDRNLFKRMSVTFASYSQPSILDGGQSSSFDLTNEIKSPKMCAKASGEVADSVQYYIGSDPLEYVI
mmetsp:Transcript_12358/g.19206  ORF Transcript_12358/g.19206 Transcript_12358/m.19206 type:complete len:90 (+) Transcript_12358:1398-1667(+)